MNAHVAGSLTHSWPVSRESLGKGPSEQRRGYQLLVKVLSLLQLKEIRRALAIYPNHVNSVYLLDGFSYLFGISYQALRVLSCLLTLIQWWVMSTSCEKK